MKKADIWIIFLSGFVFGYLAGELSHHAGLQDSKRAEYIRSMNP